MLNVCRLDQNYVIKVADFGLSENTYAKSYFRQEATAGVKLPIKWMAYESLTDGIFSEKTDVVSSALNTSYLYGNSYCKLMVGLHGLSLSLDYNMQIVIKWLHMSSPCVCLQWSFGVTCWEIFSTAKTPYPGIHPTSLIAQLENGERLPKPSNAACCDSMYVIILDVSTKDTNIYKSVIVVVVYRTSTEQG